MANAEQQKGVKVPERIIRRLGDVITVRSVFGEPIERHDKTIIPVASIRIGGGGGGGGGADDRSSGSGEGGGFGGTGRPTGVFIVEQGTVDWKPAIDVTRLVVVGNLTAVAYFFFAWLSERAKSRRH